MRFLFWVCRWTHLFPGIPLLSWVTKPYNSTFAAVSCCVFKYTSGRGCVALGGLTSYLPEPMPPRQCCLLIAASPDSGSQKAILETYEETPTFGNRLLSN